MSLTITEYFLNITMDNGNKIYNKTEGATHTLKVYSVNDSRQGNFGSQSGGDQTSIPISYTLGRKADVIRIQFRIGTLDELNAWLSSISAHRVRNTPKNLFMACSSVIVMGDDRYFGEFNGEEWLVDSFSITRGVKDRIFKGTLSLKRWYNG